MPKMLTDTELAEIVHNIVKYSDTIDCFDSYKNFIANLADLIEDHCGGEAGPVEVGVDNKLYVAFHLNDSVPPDGGVYRYYDTDVTWKDGVEE